MDYACTKETQEEFLRLIDKNAGLPREEQKKYNLFLVLNKYITMVVTHLVLTFIHWDIIQIKT